MIQKCLILYRDDNLIKEEFLSPKINASRKSYVKSSLKFSQAKAEFEKMFINQALYRYKYNRMRTAEGLGLSRQGLFRLIKKHGIETQKEDEMS